MERSQCLALGWSFSSSSSFSSAPVLGISSVLLVVRDPRGHQHCLPDLPGGSQDKPCPGRVGWLQLAGPDGALSRRVLLINPLPQPLGSALLGLGWEWAGGAGRTLGWGGHGAEGAREQRAGGTPG